MKAEFHEWSRNTGGRAEGYAAIGIDGGGQYGEFFDPKANSRSTSSPLGNHVGNGPFVRTAWKPNADVEVTKNPTFW
ncbi:MAG: hypothetical protein RL077_5894 [Verrucomicrobiota bacterium]